MMSTKAKTSKIECLGIKSIASLARALGLSRSGLDHLLEQCKTGYPYSYWYEPKKSGGRRLIEHPDPGLKRVQQRLNALLQRLALPHIFHGCYGGTHVKSNAEPHLHGRQFEAFDLADYYRNIRHTRVYAGFIALGASPDVVRAITRLTTINGHVPQGAPTSPVVAIIALMKVGERLGRLCSRIHAELTIYGDNVCISGPPHIRTYAGTFQGIIRQGSFKLRPQKRISRNRSETWPMPGLAISNGKIDINHADFVELRELLEECVRLSPSGLAVRVCPRYQTKIAGRVHQPIWVGTGEKSRTERANILAELWARTRWPKSYERPACSCKKCLCELRIVSETG